MRPFERMIRKAVVIVPSDEDYKARIEAQEKAESKEVPDTAIMEMKGTTMILLLRLSGFPQVRCCRHDQRLDDISLSKSSS